MTASGSNLRQNIFNPVQNQYSAESADRTRTGTRTLLLQKKKKKKNTNTIGELSCNPSMEAEKGTLVREVVMLDGLIARVAGES